MFSTYATEVLSMQQAFMRVLSEHPYFVSDLDVFAYKIAYDSLTKPLLDIIFFFPVSRTHPTVLLVHSAIHNELNVVSEYVPIVLTTENNF